MAIASFPFLYAFYQLPKMIIDDAILAKDTVFPVEVAGIELDQTGFLWLLCSAFLLLVIVNQGFKYIINLYAGITGERMLRRLRFDLFARILRFPLPQFRKTSSGEMVTMITAEVEPLGGFVGDAFKLPVFQGGYLLVILAFLFVQNWIMALAAVALYPLQGYLIPKLQRRVNLMGKERVRRVRELSASIGETAAGIQEVHTHNTARRELAVFSRRLGAIYDVRLQIYIWKFIIKFLNNSINQLGPFCFYAIGGWLVINGDLEFGALFAAIAAHKDLAAPWKDLLNFYQRQADAKIKYEQVIEQFQPAGMMEEDRQLEEPEDINALKGDISASGLSLGDDTGAMLVDSASFTLDMTKHVALVGGGGSGKEETTQLLAGLLEPTGGNLQIGSKKIEDLPEAVTGRRLAYVGPAAYLFATTMRDNLLYGVQHVPLREASYDEESRRAHDQWLAEATASGNSTDDPNANWIDYAATGTSDDEELLKRIFDVLQIVGLDDDIYTLGLRGNIDPASQADLTNQFLNARAEFRDRLTDPDIAALVEGFDPGKYNENATLGENLLFGTPVGDAFDMDNLAQNKYVISVLESQGLIDDLLDAGQQIASTMTELFADLPAGHPFFEQFSFISSDDLPEFQAVLTRINRDGVGTLQPEERTMILSLPFKISPARHRLGIIDEQLQDRILVARKAFAENLPEEYRGGIEFFDVDGFNTAATLQDNILFGKLAYGQAGGAERVGEIMSAVIDDLDLRTAVMEVGLGFHVGIGGGRLSGAQRQKLGIARAIMKRPDVLILNEATGSLDGAAQSALLTAMRSEMDGRGLIWAVHRASMAQDFQNILVMKSGRVIEQGNWDQLNKDGNELYELVKSE
ncbi:MAG: ABC transporter ATP-binding protein [Rhodospirillaceae bacterium TMED63]|nr:multidrug transporter [Rhodospirillaceae bacterium]RPF96926.1 MAG: ABC transporter ATP-binding protein [Rhodospirillaceae bacterium TMED63]